MKALRTIAMTLIAVAMMGMGYVFWSYQPLVAEYIYSQQWYACAQSYKVEYNDTAASSMVTTPIAKDVEECVVRLSR